MAIAVLNHRCKNLRGAIGGLVVKHYGDKVVITRKPVFKNRIFSEAQRSGQERFRQAVLFANKLMSDPRARRVYEEEARVKWKPARSLMIADFLHGVGRGVDALGAGVPRSFSTPKMMQSQVFLEPATSCGFVDICLGSITPTSDCGTNSTAKRSDKRDHTLALS